MNASEHTTSTAAAATTSQDGTGDGPGAFAQVAGFSVRVAGRVATRVDLQFAGTEQRQLGLSLGTVLFYLRSHYTAEMVARGWAAATPLAASLPGVLVGRRAGVLTTGPWTVAAMVQLGGAPRVTGGLVEARAGSEVPRVLRLRVGPVAFDLCDAASFTATLAGWRQAANLLATDGSDLD
ncbi:hypothetical protein [Pseudonocardia parietis]|uniref:Uncharacterized protein n=1 Tax=Pseudonocardia parietis TaxID=570936 RepID=A0ABS4VSJ0_9PSEU|nr:hypothetical protein [Pseudonocardia parietis]MBP2366865.1 hypothetical protein [Pseudonocardia parietis]